MSRFWLYCLFHYTKMLHKGLNCYISLVMTLLLYIVMHLFIHAALSRLFTSQSFTEDKTNKYKTSESDQLGTSYICQPFRAWWHGATSTWKNWRWTSTAGTNSGFSEEQTHLTVIMVARGPSLILLLMGCLKLIGLFRKSCRTVMGNFLRVPGSAGVSLIPVRNAFSWEHSFLGESSFIPDKTENWTILLDWVMDSGSK